MNICIIRGENYAILVTISYAFTAYWNLGKFTFSDTGKKFQYEYIPNYERQETRKRTRVTAHQEPKIKDY